MNGHYTLVLRWFLKIWRLVGMDPFALTGGDNERVELNAFWKTYAIMTTIFFSVTSVYIILRSYLSAGLLSTKSLFLYVAASGWASSLSFCVAVLLHGRAFANAINFVFRNVSVAGKRRVESYCIFGVTLLLLCVTYRFFKIFFADYRFSEKPLYYVGYAILLLAMWDICRVFIAFLGGIQFTTCVLLLTLKIERGLTEFNALRSVHRCGQLRNAYRECFEVAEILNQVFRIPLIISTIRTIVAITSAVYILLFDTRIVFWAVFLSLTILLESLNLYLLVYACDTSHKAVSSELPCQCPKLVSLVVSLLSTAKLCSRYLT